MDVQSVRRTAFRISGAVSEILQILWGRTDTRSVGTAYDRRLTL
jgi:hypothetical protein